MYPGEGGAFELLHFLMFFTGSHFCLSLSNSHGLLVPSFWSS